MKQFGIVVGALILVIAAFFIGVAWTDSEDGGQSAPVQEILVLEQTAPTLANVPDPSVVQTGGVLYVASDLLDLKGNKVGDFLGQVTTVDVTIDDLGGVDKYRQFAFNLKGGQIIALGFTSYLDSAVPLPAFQANSASAAIVGGTGEYAGIRGTLISVRREDKTYLQTLRFTR